MKKIQLFFFALPMIFSACSVIDNQGTIAELHNRKIEITGEEIVDGLDKAMLSYQRFLEQTPDSNLSPEAIRRLADLKIEKEYGFVSDSPTDENETTSLSVPESSEQHKLIVVEPSQTLAPANPIAENDAEQQTPLEITIPSTAVESLGGDQVIDDLEKQGPLEAIILYRKLLHEYPLYERNDQVLYQMSRAYEELGRVEEAMVILEQMVQQYPNSRYLDEVQFRRAEYQFSHRKYLDAEEAYTSIVDLGIGSSFYPLALYKLGWTFYKQELYEDALHKFIALLDYKMSVGYDFEQIEDESERKRVEDTFRVISLGFSYLGGADSVVEYFATYGQRPYEDNVYKNLGEYYYTKRRYSDAVAVYSAFIDRNLFHKKSPLFHMRVIEINIAGGFPSLVIEAKKSFAGNYGLAAEYWQHFTPADRPEVITALKTNLTDLANHFHALYQSPKWIKEKSKNFDEALHWYREYLVSFPAEEQSPVINYQLADLLLENHSFAEAAVEYEKTSYNYAPHQQSSKAGYAAVYAYRQQLDRVTEEDKISAGEDVIRSSLIFAETYPEHAKAAVVLGAAADDLYDLMEYERALAAAKTLIVNFPNADRNISRSAWLVAAHASYELEFYSEAEAAYVEVLNMLPEGDETRVSLVDNLAASIYKQGEAANLIEDYKLAADHFLRVGVMAPTSEIRPTAEYDAATALIMLKEWEQAARILNDFRNNFKGHPLQFEVTKKIAYVYREDGKLSLAATEFERIEKESDDIEVRQEALVIAAELYEQAGNVEQTLNVYRRYVSYFPQPISINIETRNKIAEILKTQHQQEEYHAELKQIIAIDASAGTERTARTRFLASQADLVLTEMDFERFVAVELVKPFKENLRKKQSLMKIATQKFSHLLEYEVAEVTAAATFYLAEIYAHFSVALLASERPEDLSPIELEEYELAIEEQAYPFEERAIEVHQSNLELLSLDVYNQWIEKSLQKLARFIPARYSKPEEESEIIVSLDSYRYEIEMPVTVSDPEQQPGSEEMEPDSDNRLKTPATTLE